MVSVRVKKSTVKGQYEGFEGYLRKECGLRDDVSLKSIRDGGMHGNVYFIFETPEEEMKVSGYISSPPVATYSMSVWGDRADKLFKKD